MSRQRVPNPELAADTARANLLTNGGFEIWQRGAGPFTAPGAWTADRWQIVGIGGSSTANVSRVSGGSVETGSGQYAAQIAYTHGAGGYLIFQQKLENVSDLKGRTVTFSTRVYGGTASGMQISISTSGGAAPIDVRALYATVGNQTLSVTAAIPGDSTAVFVGYVFGSVAVSGTYYVDNAMLVVGSVPADYAPLHPADDLARCLRYYEKIGPSPNAPQMRCYQAAGATFGQTLVFAAKKALTPTMTISGTFGYVNASALSLVAVGVDGTFMSASATAAGDATYYSNGSGYITAEANP